MAEKREVVVDGQRMEPNHDRESAITVYDLRCLRCVSVSALEMLHSLHELVLLSMIYFVCNEICSTKAAEDVTVRSDICTSDNAHARTQFIRGLLVTDLFQDHR